MAPAGNRVVDISLVSASSLLKITSASALVGFSGGGWILLCPFPPPPPLPSDFGNTVGVGGHARGGSPKAQSIIAWASVYPSGIHLPTRCSKAKEIGTRIPVAREGPWCQGDWKVCNEIARRPRSSSLLPVPPPPAFPFPLQLAVLPSPPLPASLKHSGIRGCCSQRSCGKYGGGEKAEREDRNTDPLGLSGGSMRGWLTARWKEAVSELPLRIVSEAGHMFCQLLKSVVMETKPSN